jgi:hypothetical protein
MTKSSRKLLSGALAVVAAVTLVVMGTPRAWSGEHREETVALKSGSGVRHSPRWFQTTRSNGHPVGCGATAWAIAFGYWAQHKGKTRLFDFDVSTHFGQSSETDPALAPVMQEIADEMGTTYPEWNGKKYGRTLAGNMCKGLEYARKRGYHTRCFRIRGSEFEKYEIVKHWIENDKPAILLNNDPAKAFTTLHYPVIEGARKRQERSAGAWRDRDVEYLVNWGAGNRDSEWISVRQVGVDTQKRYGSFSIFLFDISDQPLTQTDDVNEAICDEWCRGNPACVKCSKHVGCGVGYDRMRSWTSAGKNYYACSSSPWCKSGPQVVAKLKPCA